MTTLSQSNEKSQRNLKRSHGRYAPFGSRVLPKTMLNTKFEKGTASPKQQLITSKDNFERNENIGYMNDHISYLTDIANQINI